MEGSDELLEPGAQDELAQDLQTASAMQRSPAHPSLLRGTLTTLHERVLTPPRGKLAVLLATLLAALLSLSAAGRISVGLDQSVALPRDSYLQSYYRCAWNRLAWRPGIFASCTSFMIHLHAWLAAGLLGPSRGLHDNC